MAKSKASRQVTYDDELNGIRRYLQSDDNEDAKRPLLYPLFRKLFGEKFKIESAAQNADGYVEGQLIIEAKTAATDWLSGFYQALHYAKKGLTFSTVCVIAKDFLGVWKINQLPEAVTIFAHSTEAHKAANDAGRENARRTPKPLQAEILDVALFKIMPQDIRREDFSYIVSSYGFLKVLKNIDSERIQINPNSLITDIEAFKAFFDEPIEAIHAFYSIVAYWDVTSTIIETPNGELALLGFKGKKISEPVHVASKYTKSFTRFVETHYVFTNEGSGLTVDYYFSRFDEVLAALDPEYVRQHGIFFTDDNLSKFALWFVERYFFGRHTEESLNDYIVFDPAGGSGNLVTSWRGHLRHKIVSELQPDLLKVIEKRMRQDPYHIETGFTIIPKTVTNLGLNFLDRSADDYMTEIERVLAEKSLRIDKPLAFLLNPPYKSTDENEDNRSDKAANYGVHASITAHTGEDAAKERYLTFVAQILNICQRQVHQRPDLQPLLLIFTPTSWLIPRPTYVPFRRVFDAHFQYEDGFVVTSNEFFKTTRPLASSFYTLAV
jgi:hypothetical protein